VAAKDLQIIRTRAVPTPEMPGPSSSDRSSAESPVTLLLDIARHHWLLLSLIVVTSGAVGYFYSDQYATETVTAHLQMKSQRLPFASEDIYTVPSPVDVAADVKSTEFLEAVADESGYEPIYLARRIQATGDSRAHTLSISLTLDDAKEAVKVLHWMGEDQVIKMVAKHRVATLEGHKNIIDDQLAKVETEVLIDRKELAALNLTVSPEAIRESLQSARIQAKVARQTQLQVNIDAARRRVDRMERDVSRLSERVKNVFFAAVRQLIDEREHQLAALGRGLTATTRVAAKRRELASELAALEALIEELNDLEKIVAEKTLQPLPGDSGAMPDDEHDVIVESDTSELDFGGVTVEEASATADSPEVVLAELSNKAVEEFLNWETQITDVGRSSVGDLGATAMRVVDLARSDLRALRNNSERLSTELKDLRVDIEDNQNALDDVTDDIDGLTDSTDRGTDTTGAVALMNATAKLQESEAKYSQLIQQRDRTQRVQECPVTEYKVTSSATVDPDEDVNSNRFKLFVLSSFGMGVFLLLPIAFVEWRRLRPSPVSVMSRRWNLPTLGIQPATRQATTAVALSGASNDQHALRLMALRIQQSLFQPNGKVVLFSGLDHAESPMVLIRSLAKCFSQREEKVLIIQTLPCQLESIRSRSGDKHKSRPGVAEYLAGESDDIVSLVKNTGIVGIDFLPGGCAATASEAMASSRLTELIDQFRDRYSMILLNGPSTLDPADLQMLAARADGIVFTVSKQSLRGVYGEDVIGDLIEMGAPVLGFAEHLSRGKQPVPNASAASLEFQQTS
jgi:Mrp family chromosome partitioning ATPase/uncharacterized protein (UPF0335 family)